MSLYPQTRKTISFPLREADGFLLVEASAPSPGEHRSVLENDPCGIGYAIKIRQKSDSNIYH